LGGGINLFLYTSILGRNLLNNKLSLLKVAEAKWQVKWALGKRFGVRGGLERK
jgi:hypothetical protein